ncbi:MAG: OmpA family protein [Nitrospirales bacterium]|nr:OmpA family protein [Nitrospira sp.]MDR4502158.1 OmpA family protein [Nitrospirales bacterium]
MRPNTHHSPNQKNASPEQAAKQPSGEETSSKEILILGSSLLVLTLGVSGMWLVSDHEPSQAIASRPADSQEVSRVLQSSSPSPTSANEVSSDLQEDTTLVSFEPDIPASDSTSSLKESDIYFNFDQASLSDEAKTAIQTQISPIKDQKSLKITVQGHADQRGTDTYNRTLGLRRAEAVKAYLVAEGLDEDTIEVESFGSQITVCVEESEDCFRQNRRAHLIMSADELTMASEPPSPLKTAELLPEELVQEHVAIPENTSSDEDTSTTTVMLTEEIDASSVPSSSDQEAPQP